VAIRATVTVRNRFVVGRNMEIPPWREA